MLIFESVYYSSITFPDPKDTRVCTFVIVRLSCRSETLVRVFWESSYRCDIYFTYLKYLVQLTVAGRHRSTLPLVILWRWIRLSGSWMTSYPSTCVKLSIASISPGITRYRPTDVILGRADFIVKYSASKDVSYQLLDYMYDVAFYNTMTCSV